MSKLTMNNGVQIPQIGFGTWQIKPCDAVEAVKNAIAVGYRHIDTAQGYGNEAEVAEGIRQSGIAREEIFVTTKVVAEIKDYEGAKRSIEESLEKMQFDYIDLVIIHCPQPWDEFRGPKRYFEENKQVWKAMEEAYEAGKIKAIGVSNFAIDDVQNILDDCKVKPMINQVSTYIGNTPSELIDFCQGNGIVMEAYCPNGHGAALSLQPVIDTAAKYGITPAQLCVQYTLQLGTVSLPKSLNPVHMAENLAPGFVISEEDMAALRQVVI